MRSSGSRPKTWQSGAPCSVLARVLDPVLEDNLFAQAATTLTFRGCLFDELRHALRLPTRSTPSAARAEPSETATELKNVEQSLKTLEGSLRKRRPERRPAQDARKAIDLIDRHGSTLSGHEIRLPESVGGGVRFVERSNNLLEGFFHEIKHGERRRSGRKILAVVELLSG